MQTKTSAPEVKMRVPLHARPWEPARGPAWDSPVPDAWSHVQAEVQSASGRGVRDGRAVRGEKLAATASVCGCAVGLSGRGACVRGRLP